MAVGTLPRPPNVDKHRPKTREHSTEFHTLSTIRLVILEPFIAWTRVLQKTKTPGGGTHHTRAPPQKKFSPGFGNLAPPLWANPVGTSYTGFLETNGNFPRFLACEFCSPHFQKYLLLQGLAKKRRIISPWGAALFLISGTFVKTGAKKGGPPLGGGFLL